MTVTREDFCRKLLGAEAPHNILEPEYLAARFMGCFGISGNPKLEELRAALRRAWFREAYERQMDGLKVTHIGRPRGHYDTYYRHGLWEGSTNYTVLHEACEIIYETLWDMLTDSAPEHTVCREADRLAAAILMQPGVFGPMTSIMGLDVLALQKAFRCSCASVIPRLAEVLQDPPLMAVQYERKEYGDPPNRTKPPLLQATVVRRTRGFGMPDSFPCWVEQGLFKRKGMLPAPGSLVDRIVRHERSQYTDCGGLAIIARPHSWKGRVAKVLVVAVHCQDRAAISPQLLAFDTGCRRRELAPVP